MLPDGEQNEEEQDEEEQDEEEKEYKEIKAVIALNNYLFVDKRNEENLQRKVSSWISSDFEKRGSPESHSYRNLSMIMSDFDAHNAITVLNPSEEIIGYMTWSFLKGFKHLAEINFVEVDEFYRRKGIFKNMLSEFQKRYSDIYVLAAHVIPEAEEIFSQAGWKKVEWGGRKNYVKITAPLQPLKQKPDDGFALGICSEDFYRVRRNPDQYKDQMLYFKLDSGHPIIVPDFLKGRDLDGDGYIGLYHNRSLLQADKAKRLFDGETVHDLYKLLIIDKELQKKLCAKYPRPKKARAIKEPQEPALPKKREQEGKEEERRLLKKPKTELPLKDSVQLSKNRNSFTASIGLSSSSSSSSSSQVASESASSSFSNSSSSVYRPKVP